MNGKKILLTTLPNNQQVFCLGKEEASTIYHQVEDYFKHEIRINPGDTIFDVGANIGLFSLRVDELSKKQAHIYAFEPIPNIASVLTQNAERFNPAQINVFSIGIGNKMETVKFYYYPNASAISTRYPDKNGQEKKTISQCYFK